MVVPAGLRIVEHQRLSGGTGDCVVFALDGAEGDAEHRDSRDEAYPVQVSAEKLIEIEPVDGNDRGDDGGQRHQPVSGAAG